MKPQVIFDTECFRDYWCVGFLNPTSRRKTFYELYEGHPLDIKALRQIIAQYTLVGYNCKRYDIAMIALACDGASCKKLKTVSDKLIKNNIAYWTLGIELPAHTAIDLMEVAPGINTSLKLRGARMHSRRVQDLPFDEDASITSDAERAVVRDYCGNDLDTTLELRDRCQERIAMRVELGAMYGLDLLSKSDAQVAETIIKQEVEKRSRRKLEKLPHDHRAGDTFQYQPPAWLAFDSEPVAQAFDIVRNATFTIAGNGTVVMPKEIAKLKVPIGDANYQMGIGGLHSTEQCQRVYATARHRVVDHDVASYYPSIILACGIGPQQMGPHFAPIYRELVARRLNAKKAGNKAIADALKVAINGTFGKLGSPYSCLYAPELLIQVTLTGQLALLMLIENLEAEGIRVRSANTDGVTCQLNRDLGDMMMTVVRDWEHATGFVTEQTEYSALYSRDVNNYVAVKTDGSYKVKGAFGSTSLEKNPRNDIINDAVLAHLIKGTPVAATIYASQDIRRFISAQRVNKAGGAIDQGGRELGKTVRWYHSTDVRGAIRYVKDKAALALTDGAREIQTLPDVMPADVNREWYVQQALDALRSLGLEIEEQALA